MKNLYLIIIFLFLAGNMFSQEAYLGFGPNQTTFDYTNSQGQDNDGIVGESGIHFEGGYYQSTSLSNLKLAYAITFDQFNATGGDELNDYSWKTSYFGLQGGVRYGLIEADRGSDFALFISGGATLKKLLSGTQKINGQTFDLNQEPEFNGLFKGLYFGVEGRYTITNQIGVGLGYTYSLNYGSTQQDQTLHINSGAIVLKVFSAFY